MDQRTGRVDEHSRYYNQIAGSNPERLGALSDGIFAVSMTLLVLALAVPTAADIREAGGFSPALVHPTGRAAFEKRDEERSRIYSYENRSRDSTRLTRRRFANPGPRGSSSMPRRRPTGGRQPSG